MFFGTRPWTTEELADNLRVSGFDSGHNVILHSSFKSLGKTENGPETLVDALLSVIGPAGNLLAPTFTYSLPGWKGDPFDSKTSRARTGAIPECIRHRKQALRSFHPTHSVAVMGPEADAITKDHMRATPLGTASPFGRMLDREAKILMLGTHQDTNSSLHLCEVLAELPYTNVCFSDSTDFEVAWFHNKTGQIEFTQIREVPGCSRGFRAIESELKKQSVLKTVRIGNAACEVLNLSELVAAAKEILRKDPTLLLCHLNHCGICPKRRAFMRSL